MNFCHTIIRYHMLLCTWKIELKKKKRRKLYKWTILTMKQSCYYHDPDEIHWRTLWQCCAITHFLCHVYLSYRSCNIQCLKHGFSYSCQGAGILLPGENCESLRLLGILGPLENRKLFLLVTSGWVKLYLMFMVRVAGCQKKLNFLCTRKLAT